MDGFDGGTIAFANCVMGAAALIGTLTGFGYALLATPLLIWTMPPRIAVPLVLFSSIVLLALLTVEAFAQMDGKKIVRWVLGALPGMLVGGYVLSQVAEETMRSLIGALTLCAALLLWLRPTQPWRRQWPGALAAGLLSGVLASASGMSGPPVILFGIKQQWDHRVLRATLIGYFAIVHVLALFVLGGFGLAGEEVLVRGVAVLPGVLLGFGVGMRWRSRVDQTLFRAIALGLLCAMGGLALIAP